CTELGDGLAAAQWSNHHDARDYEGPSHHTLSCYLAGGALGLAGLALLFWPELAGHQASRETWLGLGLALL
ncbi:hypothetical protein R0G64_32550, partial [Pseudomonas otitidis]|nr:hypothetical protein [Pseudomonas otitidis]